MITCSVVHLTDRWGFVVVLSHCLVGVDWSGVCGDNLLSFPSLPEMLEHPWAEEPCQCLGSTSVDQWSARYFKLCILSPRWADRTPYMQFFMLQDGSSWEMFIYQCTCLRILIAPEDVSARTLQTLDWPVLVLTASVETPEVGPEPEKQEVYNINKNDLKSSHNLLPFFKGYI